MEICVTSDPGPSIKGWVDPNINYYVWNNSPHLLLKQRSCLGVWWHRSWSNHGYFQDSLFWISLTCAKVCSTPSTRGSHSLTKETIQTFSSLITSADMLHEAETIHKIYRKKPSLGERDNKQLFLCVTGLQMIVMILCWNQNTNSSLCCAINRKTDEIGHTDAITAIPAK